MFKLENSITKQQFFTSNPTSVYLQMIVAEASRDETDNRTSATMESKGGPDVAVAAACREVQREYWSCGICQVTTTSKITLKMHRQGKKHKATCEALKARNVKKFTFKCDICSVSCSGKYDLASHLRGKKHLAQVQVSKGMWSYIVGT
jgi:hypothetical protein